MSCLGYVFMRFFDVKCEIFKNRKVLIRRIKKRFFRDIDLGCERLDLYRPLIGDLGTFMPRMGV